MAEGKLRDAIPVVPGPWFVGAMFGAAATLGFFVNGFSDLTAWSMIVIALVSFSLPYFS